MKIKLTSVSVDDQEKARATAKTNSPMNTEPIAVES
jgi:hypothetical protein